MERIRPWIGLITLGIMLGLAFTAHTMSRGTPQPEASMPEALMVASADGAYEKLLAADQKTAWSLYAAQEQARAAGISPTAERLSLDAIAAMKQNGLVWSRVFDEMKARGLIQENNLGHVVRKYGRSRPGPSVTSSLDD